jgi:hypothetical protein
VLVKKLGQGRTARQVAEAEAKGIVHLSPIQFRGQFGTVDGACAGPAAGTGMVGITQEEYLENCEGNTFGHSDVIVIGFLDTAGLEQGVVDAAYKPERPVGAMNPS